ncbi:pyridoxamine 5'-phosphate oxidase [Lentzea sp. NBRC 105346]|uniref:pyridoxamine 5'-phosphate oxidase family protein n=1 Tax=Lentzea sp. NBRC 105346 TaxID=3032205 RepID=UPI00249FE381|nr:pyridoxamine 5'-phosphate oxidase family protein [Lentzea sp. NBRC 105346]GLZ33121.1 pyridoxamine 5'-phosphate oxidase [Lentzea sp. NBRC 105346]
MATWQEFADEEPEFAADVLARLTAGGHLLLATLRKDGSPRMGGLDPSVIDGELWLGMMLNSWKARDLKRDPRFAVHTTPGEGTNGDVRISGRAVVHEDKEPYLRALFERTGWRPDDLDLFRADITEVVRVTLEEEMVIRSWHEGRGLTRAVRT